MEAWLTAVGDIGFPVAVTFYLLTRVESKLDRLSQVIQSLSETLVKSRAQARE